MEVIVGNHTLIINPEKSCRLCLSQSLDMHNIFSSLIVDGYIVSVVDMLAYTFDITVNINHRLLPHHICNDCQKQAVAFYTFKQKIKRVEQSLFSILSLPETDSPTNDVVQGTDAGDTTPTEFAIGSHSELIELDVFEVEQDIESSVKEKAVEICRFQATNSDKTNNNSEIITNPIFNIEHHDLLIVEEKEEKDEKDSTQVQSTRTLRRSCRAARNCLEPKNSHTKRLRSEKKTSKNLALETVALKVCFANVVESNDDDDEFNDGNDNEFIDFNHHTMRLIIKHFDFFACHNCCLLFISNEKLNEHNTSSHPSIELENIDKSCVSDYTFLNDSKILKVYSCGECSKSFSTVGKLKSHVLSHASKFDCPIENCGCQYKHLARLTNHISKKHINMKHQICFHCNQSFESYDDLQTHIRNSCKAKTFECFECDKKFFSKKALAEHLKNIDGKKFKCSTCGKAFKQQSELTIHIRSHTNERPFQCTICNKSYKTSSMLTSHMDSHISGKTFECQICNTNLQSRATYRSHMKRHRVGKKHECEHCGMKFFSNYHMRLHQSNVHRENVSNIQPEIHDNNNDNLNQIMNDGDLAKFIDTDDIMNFFL